MSASREIPWYMRERIQRAEIRFEVFEDEERLWRWRVRESSGKVIAVSAYGHEVKIEARHEIRRLQFEVTEAKVEEI